MFNKIFIASDHGGFFLKEQIFKYLQDMSFNVFDLGTNDSSSVDYPDFSKLLVEKLKNDKNNLGILLCGTGIGMSIAANRHHHIRAALCTDEEMAMLSRKHNNAKFCHRWKNNKFKLAKKIIDSFLQTKFEKGRHKRLKKFVRKKNMNEHNNNLFYKKDFLINIFLSMILN